MSCGRLHDTGGGSHPHPPGGRHAAGGGGAYEYVPVGGPQPAGPDPAGGPDDTLGAPYGLGWEQDGEAGPDPGPAAGAPREPARIREPGRVRVALAGAWAKNGYMIKPFCWAAAVDGAATLVHQMAASHVLGYGPLAAVLTACGGGLTAEAATEIRNHRRKRSSTWRVLIRKQITAATLWALIAAGWTPFGWQDIVQWIALIGGIAVAWWFVHEARKARKAGARREREPEPREPLAIEPPRRIDPRLQQFIDRFCALGRELDGCSPERFRVLAYGFMFEIWFPPDLRHSQADVEGLRVLIGKLYDVTRDDVAVGYVPDSRSEARCQVIIRTRPALTASDRADPAYNRWDGRSTWDPATGLIDLGRFLDETITHYRLNTPGSGAAAGMAAGRPGAGKTGTMNVAAAEAGLAKLCSRCGPRRACSPCDPRRAWAVWMADPQMQGFSVWRGRADLTGWGPEGCVELLEFAEETAEARSGVLSTMQWWDKGPDGRPRQNTGKGWFDPEAGFPGIFLGFDELPKFVKHRDQDVVRAGLRILCAGVLEWRKLGLHLLVGTQSLDLIQIGVREIRDMIQWLNSIAHQCDEATSDNCGVTGDPRQLPGEPGVGYIAGPDRRPGDIFHTKFMPETLKPGMTGVDIRHLAGVIAGTPIAYDPGTASVMERWGVTHQQVFTEWRGRPQDPDAAVPLLTPAPAPAPDAGPGIGGLAYREDAEKILGVLQGRPDGTDIVGLMQLTGLSLGAVGRSLDALAANGQITKADDLYTAA